MNDALQLIIEPLPTLIPSYEVIEQPLTIPCELKLLTNVVQAALDVIPVPIIKELVWPAFIQLRVPPAINELVPLALLIEPPTIDE